MKLATKTMIRANTPFTMLPMRAFARASLSAILALGAAGALEAQVTTIPTPCEEGDDSPYGRVAKLCGARKGFDLFGTGDNAVAALRTVSNVTYAVANSSIGDRTVMGNELPVYIRGVPSGPTTLSARFFEYHFYQVAARGDYLRARDTTGIASLQNVRGGGYSFATNSTQYGGPDIFTGKDGTAGVLFEGAQSATGSCLDQSHAFLRNGLQLLAISDCPPTWPGYGSGTPVWRGSPYLGADSWAAYQTAVGSANFSFDFWKVPSLLADPDRQFIGTSAQTYAVSTDHGRETRAGYGNVVPGGSGDPRWEGYPLGLDYSWDAMTFNVASVGRIMVVQAKIINNSKEVYGVGIDYDSLFVGMQTRWLHAPPGSGRRASVHSIPERGAVVANELGRTANCDNARFPSGSITGGCGALTNRVGRGFNAGATGIMWLKTPIGDLRNKQFSDPNSPFYNPANPRVGDTLTFNRMSLCGFDCANVNLVDITSGTRTAERAFGTIAAREKHAIAGRGAPTDLTEYDNWMLFRAARGYETQYRVDLSNPRAGGGFNFCVPTNWRYTNRPRSATTPGNDTLFLDDCNPVTNELTRLWSDTTPGPSRAINWAFNNTWSGAGPFPLAAGDTTAMVFALITAPDSVSFMALLKDTYDFYQDFYLGPGSPPPVRIQYARADSGIAGLGSARVTLYLDFSQVQRADPSIPRTVQKLRAAPSGTPEGKLVALNPWLPDSITAKAAGVVDTIFVFKSCNGGRTFTATQTRGVCPADRSLDAAGRAVGTGWRAYSILTRDAAGNFPRTFTDNFVVGGQRYLYVFVSHRRALSFTVLDSGQVGANYTQITRTYTVLDTSTASLTTNRSAPNVVEVYVPVSAQAGASPPRVAATVVGPTPLTYHIATVTAVAPLDSIERYTTYFGDSVRVETYDNQTRGRVDSTVIRLFRNATIAYATGASTARRTFRDTLEFRANSLIPLVGTGVTSASSTVAVGTDQVVITTSRYVGLSAVVAHTTSGRPYYAAPVPATGTFQPATALALDSAPPLLFNFNSRTGFFESFWTEPGFTRLRTVGNPSIGLISSRTVQTGVGAGEYAFTWRSGEYGPGSPFRISLTDAASAEAAVAASIASRAKADSTSISQATVDIINRSLGTTLTTDSLVKLYLPFTGENLADLAEGRPLIFAARRSQLTNYNRLTLGSGIDTISVDRPDDSWIPGMPLIVIEDVRVADSTAAGRPVEDAGGNLVTSLIPRVTFSALVLGCSAPRDTCNPVAGTGATGHTNVRPQQEFRVRYYNPFTAESQFAFVIEPALTGMALASSGSGSLNDVKVVPNPYIVRSSFEQGQGTEARRLLFTHVPPQGRIRIFTVSGAFVQELRWTPEMLNGNGDLFWDMRTRENQEVGPGLYLFTIESTGPGGGAKRKLPGKFIIIR